MTVLVITRSFWADEMKIEGFALCPDEDVARVLNELKEAPPAFWNHHTEWSFYHDGPEVNVGTNESINFTSFEEFSKCIEVQPISEAFEAFLSISFRLSVRSVADAHAFGIDILSKMDDVYYQWRHPAPAPDADANGGWMDDL